MGADINPVHLETHARLCREKPMLENCQVGEFAGGTPPPHSPRTIGHISYTIPAAGFVPAVVKQPNLQALESHYMPFIVHQNLGVNGNTLASPRSHYGSSKR